MTHPFQPADPSWELLRRSGRGRLLFETWLEEQICELVPLEPELEASLAEAFQVQPPQLEEDGLAAATRQERLQRFKRANFLLQVEEHYSRTKAQRDRMIYSLLRCSSPGRAAELALAIREGELDFATAAIRWTEGPESATGGRVGPISLEAGHPALNERLAQANEGDLMGPFAVGDKHVLLRLDTRISTVLDDSLQDQLIEELYQGWFSQQVGRLVRGEKIEPIEYLPA